MQTPIITRITKGFTLIEMVVVMVILALISSLAAVLVSSSMRSYFTSIGVSELNAQASMAMLRMTKELQQAVSFSVINATQVTFQTSGGTTISYSWATPILTRTGTGARPLSKEMTSFALSYYQSSFATTAVATAVKAITINATLSNGTESIPIINTVFLNNM
jgi:prepilin-type N-terminal cleavage/methylation domain-containing protein